MQTGNARETPPSEHISVTKKRILSTSRWRVWLRALGAGIVVGTVVAASSCGYTGAGDPPAGAQSGSPCAKCEPILSPQQVSIVQEVFPHFQPEAFSPGTNPLATSGLLPSNFSPAEFLGPPAQEADKSTPMGISVETNGYDGASVPSELASPGVYFNRSLQSCNFALGVIKRSPLNLLQGRMHAPLTPGAPTLEIDLRSTQVNLTRIDEDMIFIRDQLSEQLPAVAGVDPTNAKIVIEPSIFYVYGSNFGNTWAGGMTQAAGNGHYTIHLADFYIRFDPSGNMIISNWEDYLVDEAINFYVLSVGRPDLAR